MKHNNSVFFTPGPSQLYPTVKDHIATALENNIPSISHRSQMYVDIHQQTVRNLKKLLHIPATHHVFFVSSGTGAMERIIENCVKKYSYHFVNGAFSKRFFQIAQELQKAPRMTEVPLGEDFKLNKVDLPKKTELICFTHNETSTGVMLNLQEIYKFRENYPDMLVALDIVSSAPYAEVDYTKIDCVFFSVQKGFGLPAGLGVMVVSPEALEKAQFLQDENVSTGSYHSFSSLLKYAEKQQTPETPNVLGLYLLSKVSEDFLKIGIYKIRQQTVEKAERLYAFFDKHKSMQSFVMNKRIRSQTVIVASVPDGAKPLIESLKKQGLIIGAGYGKLKESHIRIANFPAHTHSDNKRLLEHL